MAYISKADLEEAWVKGGWEAVSKLVDTKMDQVEDNASMSGHDRGYLLGYNAGYYDGCDCYHDCANGDEGG